MLQKTFQEVLAPFLESLTSKGHSPSTIIAYKSDLTQLAAYCAQRAKATVSDVTKDDIEAFRDHLTNQKYTAKSVSRKLNATKTFFRWLHGQGIIGNDASEGVAHPKVESLPPKFLSQLEYRALRDVTREEPRIYTIVELILQTGMRISEVANLKTPDLSDNSIKIEAYATQPERTIPLNKTAKEALSTYLAGRPKNDSPYVFNSKNGHPLAVRNIRAQVARYMQKAEIPSFSVNDLRTTFVIENLKNGVDLVLLSQVSGHQRLSTTERYLLLAGVTDPGKKQALADL